MTEYTREQVKHRSQEAKRLLNEPLLAEVMEMIRFDARDKLVAVDPTDTTAIMRLQAIDGNVQAVFEGLKAIVLAGDAGQSGGLVPEQNSEPEESDTR